ncbi:hypothetical protein A3D55_01140 [Candidatus Jorgensenbacteria bacterium RIFCSPHIGHO2_02_FULL_45_20]|uniref:Uncharacterized protein n=1 Tax=Candidatus Jorgensenbacteria bacterium RIFCSPHIGHO2_02_FULL_45_20 TaxID=1798470 RepID=A0A1F6BNE9_9BACT|nr:MAG: hypothetical protein A3D55_01140 [Candidatus Jorgensenbacteria bacterium RIFCSPHIGHO2_02_FULL_45_20]
MNSLVLPARVGVINEPLFEMRVEGAMQEVVKEAVSNGCFVNRPGLRVRDMELRIGTVNVGFM